jgi:hypothetical protein
MTSGYQVVIDSCVLVNAALRDTILRLAEPPHLYLPRWSAEIVDETTRTLRHNIGMKGEDIDHLVAEMRKYFPEAWVEEYEPLIPSMENNQKDRHVLAAAVLTGAQAIVTFNLKHFPQASLARWNVIAQHPQEFLIDQFHLDPSTVMEKLHQQAAERNRAINDLLVIHDRAVPEFTALLRSNL